MNHNKTVFIGQSLCWHSEYIFSFSWEFGDVASWYLKRFVLPGSWKNNYGKTISWIKSFNWI